MGAVLLWLMPFFWSGWKGLTWSWLPRALSFQHTEAGLFTQRSTRWWDQHLEGQDGKGEWHELAEQEVFPMGAFGYRTRYDRILIETGRSRGVQQIRQRLAEHVVRRLGELEAVGVAAKNPSPNLSPGGRGTSILAPSPRRGEGWGEEWEGRSPMEAISLSAPAPSPSLSPGGSGTVALAPSPRRGEGWGEEWDGI